LEGVVVISVIPFRTIENTRSAKSGYVVSQKGYQEGYFLKDGELAQIQFVEAAIEGPRPRTARVRVAKPALLKNRVVIS